MSKTFALRCESCGAPLTSEKYPLTCYFCGAENWAADKFSFSEQRAVANLRLIGGAQTTFQSTTGNGSYGAAAELFHYGLIPKELAEAATAPEVQNEREVDCENSNKHLSGYHFQIKTFPPPNSESAQFSAQFVALALVDVKTHQQGTWNFYVDETGVIRFSRERRIIPDNDSEIFDVELEQRVWL